MKITVNGAAVETAATTLAQLLVEQGKATAKVATAVNEAFVPTSARDTHALANGDRVEIVAPRQGG
ncbi:MAG: sulfur carrier protein ThiS [Pseudomonadota bacterium]